MPIYEFVCESCGGTIERLQKLSDPPPDACAECGGKMAKIMSRNSFQLKGGGWYKDLYASSSGAPVKPDVTTNSKGSDAGASKVAPATAPAAPAPAASAPSTPAAAPASTGGGSSGTSGSSGGTAK